MIKYASPCSSGREQLARVHNFGVIFPSGIDGLWNAGSCCSEGADDVSFFLQLVRHLLSSYSILNAGRIYLSGHSNGCAMAHRLVAQASDVVAAMACMSFQLMSSSFEAHFI